MNKRYKRSGLMRFVSLCGIVWYIFEPSMYHVAIAAIYLALMVIADERANNQ